MSRPTIDARISRSRARSLSAHNAAVVAEILKSSTTVTYVHLRLNEFGDEGTKALSEALKVNKTVKKLDLYGRGIVEHRRRRAAALAEVLRSNTLLTHLNIGGNNGIGKQGERLLLDAVAGREGFELWLMS